MGRVSTHHRHLVHRRLEVLSREHILEWVRKVLLEHPRCREVCLALRCRMAGLHSVGTEVGRRVASLIILINGILHGRIISIELRSCFEAVVNVFMFLFSFLFFVPRTGPG